MCVAIHLLLSLCSHNCCVDGCPMFTVFTRKFFKRIENCVLRDMVPRLYRGVFFNLKILWFSEK
jgi:hypothetical protein